MNYFKDENSNIFAYDDEQVKAGYGKDLISITKKEMKKLTFVEPVLNPKLEGDIYSLNGVDYRVSFTKDDAVGLMQIKVFFELGMKKIAEVMESAEYLDAPTDEAKTLILDPIKKAFEKTNIAFENGTLMPIKAEEFLDFAAWFAQKRNSFFEDRV